MSIESMSFVNILGDLNFLDECILKLINFKMFHIEQKKEKIGSKFKNLNEQNPYILEDKNSFTNDEYNVKQRKNLYNKSIQGRPNSAIGRTNN